MFSVVALPLEEMSENTTFLMSVPLTSHAVVPLKLTLVSVAPDAGALNETEIAACAAKGALAHSASTARATGFFTNCMGCLPCLWEMDCVPSLEHEPCH